MTTTTTTTTTITTTITTIVVLVGIPLFLYRSYNTASIPTEMRGRNDTPVTIYNAKQNTNIQ